jgi:hypothetical protein
MPGGNAFVVGDVNHAIVDTRCRDAVANELSERLEFIERSRDERLESWYR